jgi:HEAT repeat protein
MQLTPEDPENDKEKRLKNQIQSLRSGNRTTILDTIREVRSESSISILPELFDLLMDQDDKEITHAITSLLNDIKTEEAARVLTEAIDNPEYQSIATLLVSACWQNGLSYGKFANTFARVLIQGGFETAIEAFTVLEEAVGELDQNEREKLAKIIKHGMLKADDQKKLLLRELVKVIEQY